MNLLAETDDISESTGPNMYIGNCIMGVPKMVPLEHDGNIKTNFFFSKITLLMDLYLILQLTKP